MRLVRHRSGSVVVDLSTVSDAERVAYLRTVPAEVEAVRDRTGLPHWVILDEAHELLGPDGVTGALLEPGGTGYCLVTHRPGDLPAGNLHGVDVIIVLGGAPPTASVVDLVAGVAAVTRRGRQPCWGRRGRARPS